MDKKMKIIALIALLAYVISPLDLAPGPMDDMIMCLMYAIMNYKTISNPTKCWTKNRNPDRKKDPMTEHVSWGPFLGE